MKKISFAIVGCGRIAERHAGHIKNQGELRAVCDIDVARAKVLGEKFGAAVYPSIEEMLAAGDGLDVVSVCTPNGLHAEHTIKSLQAGCHVLCEKPMAITVHQAGAMIDASLKAGRRLFVVKQNRYNPPVEAVKAAIDQGSLGRILSVQVNCFWNRRPGYYQESDWKGTKDLDGGTLFTQFSHFVDLVYWMVGDIREARAFTGNLAHEGHMEFEDTGVVALEFHNGALGAINYTVNSYGGNMEGSITIFGEKGSVKIGGQYLNELEYQNIEDFKIEDLPGGNPPNEYGQYQGSMSNHDKIYENVVAVLNNGGTIGTNGFEGLKTVEIIDKIYRSARAVSE